MKPKPIWFAYYTFIASMSVCAFVHWYVVLKEWQNRYAVNQGQLTAAWELAVYCKAFAYIGPILTLLACFRLNGLRKYLSMRLFCAVAFLLSCMWAMFCIIAWEIQAVPQIDLRTVSDITDVLVL